MQNIWNAWCTSEMLASLHGDKQFSMYVSKRQWPHLGESICISVKETKLWRKLSPLLSWQEMHHLHFDFHYCTLYNHWIGHDWNIGVINRTECDIWLLNKTTCGCFRRSAPSGQIQISLYHEELNIQRPYKTSKACGYYMQYQERPISYDRKMWATMSLNRQLVSVWL